MTATCYVTFGPCQLPTGYKAAHWTACRTSPKETS